MNTFNLFRNGIKNVIPSEEITILDFINLLKQENKIIELIRTETDKKKRDELKSKLSYVTFGGTFTRRGNKSLIESSGLACFDIDDLLNLEEIKSQIIKSEFTHLLFVSPSGKGLKLIVKIPCVSCDEEYKQYWVSIANHFNFPSNDESTKDISRACYLSIDKFPYFNQDSKVYTEILRPIAKEKQRESGGTVPQKSAKPPIEVREEVAKISKVSDKDNFLDKLKSSISMTEILNHFGVDTSINPTNCPFHSCSQRCLSFNDNVCNCFDTDCGRGYNIFSFIQKIKGLSSAETIKWLSYFAGLQKEYEESKQNYLFNNDTRKPMGWANSINIKRMAERRGWLSCPKCNIQFIFNDVGFFKCPKCKTTGGIKNFVSLFLQENSQ